MITLPAPSLNAVKAVDNPLGPAPTIKTSGLVVQDKSPEEQISSECPRHHLPLDVHPEVGNNVQLAHMRGLTVEGPLEPGNPRSVGLVGSLDVPLWPADFMRRVQSALGREPVLVEGPRQIKRVAWCTGGAQGYIEKAVVAGVDAYLTGEISEPTAHIARENQLSFFAAGHHATERYGVKALGEYLAKRYDIEHVFIDCPNPA